MRVFMTGGTGYVGSAVLKALVEAGHQVTGLARSDASAQKLGEMGAEPLRGDLQDPSSYEEAAREHDALVSVAADYSAYPVVDASAIETLLAAAAGAGAQRSFIYTSGCWVLGDTGATAADETASTAGAAEIVAWRPAHEKKVLKSATDALATAVIRPGMVYGGKGGTFAGFFKSAAEEGAARYVGNGENHWSVVHRDDLAQLYRLVLEKHAGGIFHGVDGMPTKVKELARAAAEAAGASGATRTVPVEEARKELGPMADAICLDQFLVTPRAAELGWQPQHPSFVESAKEAFTEWSA